MKLASPVGLRPPSSTAALFIALIGLALARPALAVSNLKQIQVSSGSRIDLLFDGKIAPAQIRQDYINDIVQLTLTDASVYPAKIQSVSGGEVTKIFAYQYAPKVVRFRMSVKGKAESYKDRVALDVKGKQLTVRFNPASASASAATSDAQSKSAAADRAEEKALLDRVLKAQEAPAPSPAKSAAKPAPKAASAAESAKSIEAKEDLPIGRLSASEPLATGKPLMNPGRILLRLLFVFALFVGVAVVLKQFGRGRASGAKPVKGGALARFVQRGLGRYGKQGRMIEVVSNHYLGPKQSIAVVKVAGRMLVLGISNESINLITQLSGQGAASFLEEDAEGAPPRPQDEAGSAGNGLPADLDLSMLGVKSASAKRPAHAMPTPAVNRAVEDFGFADLLGEEASKPSSAGARARIRSRLEGMKPL